MELDNISSQLGRDPSRRFNPRIVLAVLVAVLAAAVAAAGLAFANNRSATVGSGVVVIETNLAYQGEQAAGTGMVLTSSGEVLTNNHVIRGATTVKIVVPGTGLSYNAEVVGYDASHDVAVLQASDAANLKTISLGDSSSVDTGESVQAVGNAGGTGRFTSASGTVTALNRSITVSDDQGGSESLSGLIETNAAVRPGDSGGPLFDSSGQAIGMDTAASAGNDIAQTGNEGYAIPIEQALSIVKQIEDGNGSGTVHVGETAFLGVEVTSNDYGGSGATVSSVLSRGSAAAAGLAPGDVITAFGGRSIASPADLGAVVASHKPGESVSVSYFDQNGTAGTMNVTLASGPPL